MEYHHDGPGNGHSHGAVHDGPGNHHTHAHSRETRRTGQQVAGNSECDVENNKRYIIYRLNNLKKKC